MQSALAALMPPELRELLRGRALRVARPVWGGRAGRHAAARAGLGDEFRGHRAYVPGDDLRRLDWRAAGRSDRLVLRQHDAEDVASLVLLVDGSGGMAYGTGPARKASYAAALAAALGGLAARQGDRVGLARAAGGELQMQLLRPQGGARRVVAAARALAEAPAGTCSWPRLLAAVTPQLPRRALLVLVSDFLDPCAEEHRSEEEGLSRGETAWLDELAALVGRGYAALLLQVLHRDELEFPWTGRELLRFEDLREGRPPIEGQGAGLRAAYRARVSRHLAALSEGCAARGIALQRAVTDQPTTGPFLGLLRALAGGPAAEVA